MNGAYDELIHLAGASGAKGVVPECVRMRRALDEGNGWCIGEGGVGS